MPSRVSGKVLAAGTVGFMLAALTAGALAPSSASAGILGTPIPDPVDAVKGLIGIPGHVASALGATVLQEALAWLLGGLKATITLELVKFLVRVELAVGHSLSQLTGPMIVIGGFFLVVGLITSIGDGYREVVAGTDTGARVVGQAIFRVIGLAILLASWFWIVPLAVDVANGMSGYVLGDQAVASALRRTFAGDKLLHVGFPLLGLITGIMLAFAILALVVLKFIIAIAFAALYVGGPALIGFAALPKVGNLPLAIATRGLITLTIIPLLWTVVFAAWAGVSAGMFDTVTGDGAGAIAGLMGPGLFLAGLVVMLGVTKKVLAMATFGVALAVPGGAIARSAITMAIARGFGSAAGRTVAAAAAARDGDEGSQTSPRPRGEGQQSGNRETRPRTQPAPSHQRQYRTLDTNPDAERVERDRARARRRASTANSALGVDRDGAFVPPRHAPRAEVQHVTRAIEERRARGDVTVDDVRHAGDVLTSGDRGAFAAAAEAARQEGPQRAQRHFERTASVQIAGAPALDRPEREAAITIASAHPDVVRRAFAPDYQSFGQESESPRRGYDPRLMDQQGGLEQYRREFEGDAGSRGTPADDEGLPF